MVLSSIRAARDFIDFSCRDTGGVGMSLELGRLFHLWGRRAVVSVGVCMVVDLQLIRENQPRRSHHRNLHQSLNHLYPQLSVLFLSS